VNKFKYHFLCLCPIWNHRHETTQSAIACFLAQKLPEKTAATLLLLDDRPDTAQHQTYNYVGDHAAQEKRYIASLFFQQRQGSLGLKYTEGIKAQTSRLKDPDYYSHIAIWDDDDLFLPGHLASAVAAYETSPDVTWTYPDEVFSTFGNQVQIEQTGGRFWSSMTTSLSYLQAYIGGFELGLASGYDQITLGKLKTGPGKRGIPSGPTYVYRWGAEAENHTSGYSKGFHDETWYDETPYSNSRKRAYWPVFDGNAKWVWDEIATKYPEVWRTRGDWKLVSDPAKNPPEEDLVGHGRWG
jgi:hypothetical protein